MAKYLAGIFILLSVTGHWSYGQFPSGNLQSRSRYEKWGIGRCPKVLPMQDVDIPQIYGKWYLIAQYADPYFADRHCLVIHFDDGNPGKDLCRLSMSFKNAVYDDGSVKSEEYFRVLPNDTQPAVWINTFHNSGAPSTLLATDYKGYLVWHECIQFPRDFPILYEQHNYICSRTAKGEEKDLEKIYELFESFEIDVAPFVMHDQEDCI